MKYYEIWNIEPLKADIDYFPVPIIVGVALILYETIALYSRKKWGEDSTVFTMLDSISRPKYPYSKIFFPVGAIAIVAGIIMIQSSVSHFNEVNHQVLSAPKEIVEGVVKVEFKQSAGGHSSGDIIHVGDETFKLSTYMYSYYYHEAIANGGLLTDGENVRIHFIRTKKSERSKHGDGKIVKIEITQ